MDPFEEYQRKYGGGDPFEAYRQQYGGNKSVGPEKPSLRDRLRQALSPRAHADAAKMLVQGVTLGAGDEIRAALRAIPAFKPGGQSPGEAYRSALQEEGADIDRIRTESPVASLVAEGVGSLAPAAVSGGAAAALRARSLPSAGRVLGESAGLGGVYGFNEGEGGVLPRTFSGALGAVTGLAGGAVVSGVTQPLTRPIVGGVSRALAGGTAGAVLDDENRVRGFVTGAGAATTAPYALRAMRRMDRAGAIGDVSSVQGAAPRPDMSTREEGALVRVLRALRRDEPDVDLADIARQTEVAGKPLTITDRGANIRGLARAARTVGGRAKQEIPEALSMRGAGQEERILNDLLETTGLRQRSGVVETVDELTRRRAQEAAPLYEAAFSNPNARRITDPEILALLERPSMRNALSRARQLAEEEGAPLVDDVLDLRTLDYIKRALDDDLFLGRQARMTGQGGLGPGMERAALENRAKLLARLDELVPEYAQARAASAGPAAERAAFESGLDLFKMRPAEAQKLLGQMGDAEKEQFRRGAMEALSERLEGTSQRFDVTKRRPLDDSTLDRQRLRLLFDSEEGFNAFKDRLADEVRMAQTQGFVTGGSNTADKLAEVADLFDLPLEQVAAEGVQGGIPGAIASVIRGVGNRVRAGYTTRTADDLVEPLTAGARGDADNFAELIRRLQEIERRQRERNRLVQPARRGVSGVFGGRAGS